MKYAILPVTPFEQNCSFLQGETTGKVAVVDPGGDLERIRAALVYHEARIDKGGIACVPSYC